MDRGELGECSLITNDDRTAFMPALYITMLLTLNQTSKTSAWRGPIINKAKTSWRIVCHSGQFFAIKLNFDTTKLWNAMRIIKPSGRRSYRVVACDVISAWRNSWQVMSCCLPGLSLTGVGGTCVLLGTIFFFVSFYAVLATIFVIAFLGLLIPLPRFIFSTFVYLYLVFSINSTSSESSLFSDSVLVAIVIEK